MRFFWALLQLFWAWLQRFKACPPFWFHCWTGHDHCELIDNHYHDKGCKKERMFITQRRTCCRCEHSRIESL